MGTMARCSWLFVLLLIYTDISYLDAHGPQCEGQNANLVKFQEGTTYVYNLEGITETTVPKSTGPNGESTKLSIKAKVEVNAQAKCAVLIRLQNVQVTGPDDKKYTTLSLLEENPLRVSFNGGRLGNRVDVVKGDDYTSLNIKRAVASLLQTSATVSTTTTEIDVFGSCPTQYSVDQSGDGYVVRKTRNLNECAYREHIRHEIFAVPSSGNSMLQSSPLLDPSFESEIRIKGGVVESAIAREEYLLRPFADKANGAKTKVTTKLSLVSKGPGVIPDNTSQDRSIIFENPHETVSSTIQSVLAALHKVADHSVGEDAARNVAELVAIIRRASAENLLSVYGQVKAGAGFQNKNLARKVFTDALFRSGSGDSVAVAVELLTSRQITGDEAKIWYLSFGFARHVTTTALDKAAALVEDAKLPKEAYLGVGALAGKYCREHQCDNVVSLQNLVNKLASPIAKAAPSSRADEAKVIAHLKALRNVKYLTEDAAGKVANVAKDTKVPTRVRSAALDTAVSDACKKKLQKAAADVLNNREEDAELRIKAYLVLVECPTAQTANKLSEMLETENVNQVGAFISSHLRNLRATARPERQAARAVLQNVKPRRRYPFDLRKYSQNYELSYDIDALGTSASIDSNVIFSQKSYLPRSANLNLTAEIFGHAFNIIELNGRAENLERVLERFVGPRSYLRTTKPEDIIRDGQSRVQSLNRLLKEKYEKLSRSRRDVSRNDVDNFAKKVKLYNNELDNNVDIDLSLRLLGNEVLWTNLGEATPLSPEDLINKITEVLERGFGTAKDFEQKIQNHAVFLDTELAYPTASGLAVKVSATGTSVVHLKVAGSADLAALLKDPDNGQAKIEIRPSASLEIVGQLSVDGYAVEAGVKLAANLHTETGSEVSIKLLNGEGIDINIGLPVKDSDILTVNTEVLVAVREYGRPQSNTQLNFQVPRNDYQECFDQLMPLIGLNLCGKIGFPRDAQGVAPGAALFPLNGHSKVSLRLNKEDESLTNFHFRLQYSLKDPTNRRIEAIFDTPGSKKPREVSILAEAKTVPNKEVNFKVVTPLYKFRTQGKIIDTDSEYSLSGLAELEGVFAYKARLGLLINGATYTPVLEYTAPDGQNANVNVRGTITVEKAGPAKRTYTFNDVRVASPQGDISVNGPVTRDTNLFKTDITIGYGPENVKIKSKFQRQDSKNIKVLLEVSPSQVPDFGFSVKYDYQRDKKQVENTLVVTHGPDLTATTPRLSMFQKITYDIEGSRFDVSTQNTITYPLFGIQAKFDGAISPKRVNYDMMLGYDKNTAATSLDAKISTNKPGDYQISFSASALEHGVTLEAKRDIVAPNKSKFTNKLVITPGGKYTLNGDITHQLDKNDVNVDADIVFTLEGSPDAYNVNFGVVSNPSRVEAHSRVAIGGDKIIDAEFKRQLTEPLGVSFKLNLKNAIESNGDYKRTADKATAHLLINLIPLSRKIKGSADLTASGSKHQGSIELLYDADRDPSKKVVIQTETDLTRKSINSKNKISHKDREAKINFNGEVDGQPGRGSLSGGYDIVLPNGYNFVARVKHALNLIPSNSDGELFLEFGYSLQQGEPLTKITLDSSARNVDLRNYAFDVKSDVSFTCPNGNAYYKQSVKSVPQDRKWQVDVQNSIGGSHLGEYQYNGKLKATVSKAEVSYHGTASLGQKYSIDATGKVRPGVDDSNLSLEQTINVKTPVEQAKDVKLTTNVKYVKGDGETTPCQLKLGQELILGDKTYKISLDGKGTKKDGDLKGSATLGSETPYTAALSYKHNHENEIIKSELTIDAAQGSDAFHLNVKSDYTKSLTLLKTLITGSTPLEKAKKFDFAINFKRISNVAANADAKFTLNNDVTELGLKYDINEKHPLIDATASIKGDKYRVYYKGDKKNDRNAHAEGQLVWANNGGGQYDWSATVDLESLENFHLLFKVHSEKLGIQKLKIELGNRPGKGGAANKVNLVAQNKDGKILSGTATYTIKDVDGGFSVEGKGSLTYNNEQHPLTYKLSQNLLSKNANNENGRTGLFEVDFGIGKYRQYYVLSDKQFRFEQDVCWKKECSKDEYVYQVSYDGVTKSQSELKVISNHQLTIQNVPKYNFELTSKSERDGLLGSCDSRVVLNGISYALRSYAKTTEAALIATVPSRELALIAHYEVPKKKDDTISAKTDISLYLDHIKNPQDKATLTADASLKYNKDSATATAAAKFSHKSLPRELSVKAEAAADIAKTLARASLELDVLSKKSQKIILSAEVEQLVVQTKTPLTIGTSVFTGGRNYTAKASVISKGLVVDIGANAFSYGGSDGVGLGAFVYYVDEKNIKKDAGGLATFGPKDSAILVKIPGHIIVDGSTKVNTNKDVTTVDGELTIVDGEPAVFKVTLKGLQELQATLSAKSNPRRALVGLISLSSQKFEVRADRRDDNGQEPLVYGIIHLDEANLFKIEYDALSQNIKKTVDYFENLIKDFLVRIRAIGENLSKELNEELKNLSEAAKKALPNFKNINEQYEKVFKAIRDEIENDKNFQQIAAVIKPILGNIVDVTQAQIKIITAALEKVSKEITEIQGKLVELQAKLYPELIEVYKKIFNVFTDLISKFVAIGSKLVQDLLAIYREHEKDIKAVVNKLTGSLQDVGRIALKNFAQLRNELRDLVQLVLEQVKELPIVEILREKLKELSELEPPEHFYAMLEELKFNLEQLLPLKEQQDFVNAVFDDIRKLIKEKHIAVDDLIELGRLLVEAAEVTWKELNKFSPLKGFFGEGEGQNTAPSLPKLLTSIPNLAGALKLPQLGRTAFSPFNLLSSLSELPTPVELYAAYRPNVRDLIPPHQAYGIILKSHHFFTFDKTHFTIQGSCSYVLAQDFLDGNFSVVANLKNGHLHSITVTDKQDVVEVLPDNTVVVNGKASDYPVNTNEISGWRRYDTVNIKTKSGVFIKRYLPHDIYVVYVSGFYFGRTRGLLGTINNEQYDELTLPNGHIAKNTAEFVNAYALSQCAPVAPSAAKTAHVSECTQFFTSESSLRNYFPFLSPETYREACDAHAAMNPGQAIKGACEVAAAYVVGLRQEGIYLPQIPSECAQCTVGAKKLELGQTAQTKRAVGKADVVVVFEQSTQNSGVFKDLITPLVSTLSADLKARGLADVEFSLIGFGGDSKWPAHYPNNGKLAYSGKSDNIRFSDGETLTPPYDTPLKKIKYAIKYIQIELGLEGLVIAMNEANKYPFRQGAAKIIILVNTTPCSRSVTFPVSLQLPRILAINSFYKANGLSFFMVSPLAGIALDNGKEKSVVGFDAEKVYYLDEKKQITGNAEDRQKLGYPTDFCLEFSQYYGGAAFSSQNLLDAKPDQKKRFVEIVSQRVTNGALKYTYTDECVCSLKKGITPVTKCTVASSEIKS